MEFCSECKEFVSPVSPLTGGDLVCSCGWVFQENRTVKNGAPWGARRGVVLGGVLGSAHALIDMGEKYYLGARETPTDWAIAVTKKGAVGAGAGAGIGALYGVKAKLRTTSKTKSRTKVSCFSVFSTGRWPLRHQLSFSRQCRIKRPVLQL